MKYLLDSNALLRALFEQSRLSKKAADAIDNRANTIMASAVSPYELEWKKAIGKLVLPTVIDWLSAFRAAGYEHLPISAEHTQAAARLPLLHRDPWDRVLIAQARAERLTLVTSDTQFAAYGVPTLW